jgi:hypothetical protein
MPRPLFFVIFVRLFCASFPFTCIVICVQKRQLMLRTKSKNKTNRFLHPRWILIVEICCSAFQHVRIICTPQKCSGFNQIEEAKVSFRDMWLDTPCRIHYWCQQKADPVKGLKMSRGRSAKVLTLSESSRTSWMTQKEA